MCGEYLRVITLNLRSSRPMLGYTSINVLYTDPLCFFTTDLPLYILLLYTIYINLKYNVYTNMKYNVYINMKSKHFYITINRLFIKTNRVISYTERMNLNILL